MIACATFTTHVRIHLCLNYCALSLQLNCLLSLCEVCSCEYLLHFLPKFLPFLLDQMYLLAFQ